MKTLETPILFLIFNRPDATRLVFEKIREVKPQKLYIAADGPRRDKIGEDGVCEECRNIVMATIDWPCVVQTLFRQDNLGCGKAVSEAINWFFEQEEEGIILEDDCLPDSSFFEFCSVLLKRHKYDDRIMHIGGNNFQFGTKRGSGDYYYSILGHIWGWATWRRAWKHYEFNLVQAKPITETSYHLAFDQNDLFINYYRDVFSQVRDHKIDTWDYQWLYTIIRKDGLAICPCVNLVQNIGFGLNATHTLYHTEWNTLNIAKELYSFEPPATSNIDYEADAYTLREIIGIKEYADQNKKSVSKISTLKNRARGIFNRLTNRLK